LPVPRSQARSRTPKIRRIIHGNQHLAEGLDDLSLQILGDVPKGISDTADKIVDGGKSLNLK
jgi:hypothetical protein